MCEEINGYGFLQKCGSMIFLISLCQVLHKKINTFPSGLMSQESQINTNIFTGKLHVNSIAEISLYDRLCENEFTI